MNNSNLTFVMDDLKYLGFGAKGGLQDQVREKIEKEEKSFTCSVAYNYDGVVRMEADLYFRRGDKTDVYFFNKYDARLIYETRTEADRAQTFYISKGRGFTRKEAFNLLQGRSVNKNLYRKDGEKYNAWVLLNFDQRQPAGNNYQVLTFGERYGYELETVLEKFQIREMDNPQLRDSLIYSLKKGNLHTVTFSKENNRKMLIEANPRFKSINIYHQLPDGKVAIDNDPFDVENIPPETEQNESPGWDESDPEEEKNPVDLPFGNSRPKRPRKRIATN